MGVGLLQPCREPGGQRPLLGAVGLAVPLRGGGVVEGDEGRLAAHRQPDVAGDEPLVDRLAERVDPGPLLLGVGQRDARVLVDATYLVVEGEAHLDRLGGALDRRCAARVGGREERDVALAGEEAAGGVHADPPGAGDEDLGPGVQVGEVLARTAGAVEGLLVGGQLDEVAGDETRREPVLAQQGHEQPGAVAAGADPTAQRLVGRLDPLLHPDAVGHLAVDRGVEVGEELHGRYAAGLVDGLRHRAPELVGGDRVVELAQVGEEVGVQARLVGERDVLGVLLDEEVERVDHHQVGDQADGDLEGLHLLGEDQAGQPVAEGVLLPVDEVGARRDVEGVGLDGGAAVRGRPQPDHVGTDVHGAREVVGGAVLQRDLDRHGTTLPGQGVRAPTRVSRSMHPPRGEHGATGRGYRTASSTRGVTMLRQLLSRVTGGAGRRPTARGGAMGGPRRGAGAGGSAEGEMARGAKQVARGFMRRRR